MKDFIARIGTFFILMGIGIFLLFIASDASAAINQKQAEYPLLCGGVLLVAIGILFRGRASPPQSAERFRTIHKIQERRKVAKEEKAKAQKK